MRSARNIPPNMRRRSRLELPTGEPREQPGPAVVERQPPLGEDLDEASGVGRDDQVTSECEVAPRAYGGAVHGGDGRLWQLVQAQRAPSDRAHQPQRGAGAISDAL